MQKIAIVIKIMYLNCQLKNENVSDLIMEHYEHYLSSTENEAWKKNQACSFIHSSNNYLISYIHTDLFILHGLVTKP